MTDEIVLKIWCKLVEEFKRNDALKSQKKTNNREEEF